MLSLLLVSVMAQLVSQAPTHQPLHRVIEEATKYNMSLYKDFRVEDVRDLMDAGCNDDFFCKVQQILIDHHHKNKKVHDDLKVLRTLNVYINETKINCDEALRNVMKSDKTLPFLDLLENLSTCSRLINFNGRRTTPSRQITSQNGWCTGLVFEPRPRK